MHRSRSQSKKRSRSPSSLPQSPVSGRQRSPLPKMPDPPQLIGAHQVPSLTIQNPEAVSPVPKVAEIPAFLQLSEIEKHHKFMEITKLEMSRLAERRDPSMESQWSFLRPDKVLDRYNNIHPWYNNRITLQVPEGVNDYINASPVSLASDTSRKNHVPTQFIAMQGPKKETIDHTWMMIWQALSNPMTTTPGVIIMLTPTHVGHPQAPNLIIQEKCYPYYPLDEESEALQINETSVLGSEFKATVRCISREEILQGNSIELRKLAMKVDGIDEEKIIWHFLYPGWPDFGALAQKDVESIIALMHLSREKNINPENPRIVHCSAGVGRSGTFIALEYLIGELDAGAWENWDDEEKDPIFETVNALRMQRRTMVQAYEQYDFLYTVMKRFWEEKYGVPNASSRLAETGTVVDSESLVKESSEKTSHSKDN